MLLSRRTKALLALLGLATAGALVWPLYRAFLPIDIDVNEGWNAYWADAAWRGTKLYPTPDQLVTNNYPPLSFYVVGASGAALGDTVLAGRLISLLAILAMSVAVGLTVRRLGGSTAAALVGGLYCASAFLRLFLGYAGMNDPQLLAHAVMAFGFLGFLRAVERDRGYLLPIAVMVLAGFIKHNIPAMPVTAFFWLAYQRPRRFVPLALFALLLAGGGLAICHFAYGPDYLFNLRLPRVYDPMRVVASLGQLQWLAVGLVVWSSAGVALRRDPVGKLLNVWVLLGLVLFLVQLSAQGVGENSQFDLALAVSVAMGVTFARAAELPLAKRYSPDALRSLLLVAILVRLIASPGLQPYRLLLDPGFPQEIALREAAMTDAIARIRAVPGEVECETILCYRAGKPFVVDHFNLSQRMKTGNLPKDSLYRRIADGSLVHVPSDPRHSWAISAGVWGAPAE